MHLNFSSLCIVQEDFWQVYSDRTYILIGLLLAFDWLNWQILY